MLYYLFQFSSTHCVRGKKRSCCFYLPHKPPGVWQEQSLQSLVASFGSTMQTFLLQLQLCLEENTSLFSCWICHVSKAFSINLSDFGHSPETFVPEVLLWFVVCNEYLSKKSTKQLDTLLLSSWGTDGKIVRLSNFNSSHLICRLMNTEQGWLK